MTAKKTTTDGTQKAARRRATTAKKTTSAPAVAGTTRRAKATADGRGHIQPHPIVTRFNAAAVALAEHLSVTAWGYASLVIIPPDPGSVGAPPSIVIRIDNPDHATTAPTG